MAGWQATLTRIIRYLFNAFAVPSRPARVRSGPEWSALVLGLGFVVAAQAEAPDFLRDVRPVLSQHCFKCHGPDEQARKAGLRLDQRDAALAPLRSGKPAIVPGSPDASEFVKRLYTEDEDDLMPPPATKRPLTGAQKDVLRRWVAAGAPYQPHWAFLAPKQVEPPAVRQTEWPLGPLDHFVLARLEAEGLAPSPPADRHRLIRRVSLDLIRLPPTPEEADAFARDPAPEPEAYARVVDRLLASPHYGERWARRWLDLARYADTNGFEKDRPRSIWPWRDWVIEALNADLPFDQFTIQQLAGDLLPGATPAQRIATGFHRNTMLNEEGGIDPLEYRFYSVVDRVNTTGTTWLGLTVGCAQCHTHKYDPISQREYYRFLAFLNNADEPVLEVPSPELEPKRRAILAEIASLEADLVHRFPRGTLAGRDARADVRGAERRRGRRRERRHGAARGGKRGQGRLHPDAHDGPDARREAQTRGVDRSFAAEVRARPVRGRELRPDRNRSDGGAGRRVGGAGAGPDRAGGGGLLAERLRGGPGDRRQARHRLGHRGRCQPECEPDRNLHAGRTGGVCFGHTAHRTAGAAVRRTAHPRAVPVECGRGNPGRATAGGATGGASRREVACVGGARAGAGRALDLADAPDRARVRAGPDHRA
ncbi:MAG: DUF1549 domain-containing protein [Verrucomicrobia bacterium]|nr:DUF1549 domain-containing protein [Verrucomicrobiota bacterium]